MSKSIIGFYSEPLSLKEREEIFSIMYPVIAKQNFVMFTGYLESLPLSLLKKHNGESLSNKALAAQLTELLVMELHTTYWKTPNLDYIKHDIAWSDLLELKMEVYPMGGIFLTVPDKIKELASKGLVLTKEDLEITPHFVDKCNAYLTENPDERIFEKSDLAINVDKLNSDILKKLNQHGYQSETSAPIFDFSKEILNFSKSLIKENKCQ